MKATDLLLEEALRHLLIKGLTNTQEEIKQGLAKQGFNINQSKISRLLKKLGAIKVVNSKGVIVYRLPKEPSPPAASTTVSHLVLDIIHNETLIIVRTSPGSASMIARVLDYQLEEIESLGSIAGDDTILVIPVSVKNLNHTFKAVKALLLT